MGHSHSHTHDHHHEHSHDVAADLSISDSDLDSGQLGRRNFLRAAGAIGAGAAVAGLVTDGGTASAAGVVAGRKASGKGSAWLAGDHHIHTQFSSDAMYRVVDQVQEATRYGLDWMVITDHGSEAHAKIGVEKVNPHIRDAREEFDTLVFQGLEWNIPAAEHSTVMVHPGRHEVAVMKEFENKFDGAVKKATDSTPENEKLALAGLAWLRSVRNDKRVADALFMAHHPARKGIDSPHEFRNWRDTAPEIAVGMEGAPGHQAAGIAKPHGSGEARGYYGNKPDEQSFAAYPLESYRTFGGFDWITATVGGLWDSLLAEGKPWWITANSDSHSVYLDPRVRGEGGDFERDGQYPAPTYGQEVQTDRGDFWPGQYSRTLVGSSKRTYAGVMQGLRDGRVWVDHGRLVGDLDVTVEVAEGRSRSTRVGLGGIVTAKPGATVTLVVKITKAHLPNWAGIVPNIATVDAITGVVTGPATDRDVFNAPETKVTKSWDIATAEAGSTTTLRLKLGKLDNKGMYVRLRGSDGNRLGVGLGGAKVDPSGPVIDQVGDANPWVDLWFYTNPIFVLPVK